MYIELGGSHSLASEKQSNDLVNSLMSTKFTLDSKMKQSQLSLLSGVPLENKNRRRVEFLSEDDEEEEDGDGDKEGTSSEGSEEDVEGLKKRKMFKAKSKKTPRDDEELSSEEEKDMKLLAGTKQKARKLKERVLGLESSVGGGAVGEEADSEDDQEGSEEEEEEEERGGVSIEDFMDLEAKEEYKEMSCEEEEEMEEEEVEDDGESSDDESGSFFVDEAREAHHVSQRLRRPVVFESDSSDEEEEDTCGSIVEEEEEMSEDEKEMDDCETDVEDEVDDEDSLSDLKWKTDLTKKAERSFKDRYSRSAFLKSLIYGTQRAVVKEKKEEDGETEVGGLFHVRVESKSQYDSLDTSLVEVKSLRVDWADEEVKEAVKSLFVTGSWGEEDARKLLEEEEREGVEEVDEIYGDFEDFETGEVHKEGDEEERDDGEKERRKKKEELKKAFDKEYDEDKDEVCIIDVQTNLIQFITMIM